MGKSKNLIAKYSSVLFGLIICTILVWWIYIFLASSFKWFSGLESKVAASIITASAVALVSTAGLIISKQYEHKREIRHEHNKKKIPVYEELIGFTSKIQFAEKLGKEPVTEQEIFEFTATFTSKLVIWGGEDVIKSYCRFRDMGVETKDSLSVNILFEYENLLCNIRKDLGHKDKSIKRGDILRLFITDINKYL